MKTIITAAAVLLLFFSCGTKNPTVRETVKKKVGDNQSIGVEEYKKGNYVSARLFLESALKDAYSIDNIDGVIDAMRNLAEVHLQTGNYTDASNYVFRAKAFSDSEGKPGDTPLFLTLGKYYDRTGGYDPAYQNYQSAMKAAKTDVEKAMVYNSMGITKMKQGLLDEAMEIFGKSLAINESKQNFDSLGDNYFNLGEVYDRKNDPDKALSNYQLALANDKISEKSDAIIEDLKRIGLEYGKLKNGDQAVYFLNRALSAAESRGLKSDVDEIQKLLGNIK